MIVVDRTAYSFGKAQGVQSPWYNKGYAEAVWLPMCVGGGERLGVRMPGYK